MSQPAAPPPPPPSNPWAKRLWWMVPLGCVTVLAAVTVFIAGTMVLVFSLVKGSGAYANAMEIASAHPAVIEALGEPVEARWYVMGSIQTSGSSGNADISIPVAGPNGKGTVYVVATKQAGEWYFNTLSFKDDSGGPTVDLLDNL